MAEQIMDGTGSGYLAKVNSDNQLLIKSVNESEAIAANQAGDAYNLNTGIVSLTNAVDTPLIYVKNNELTKNLVIEAVIIGLFNSTGGSATADVYATIVRNPTTGTIISSTPTDIPINSNRNYTSSNTLVADTYVGATGDTMTDGDDHILVRVSAASRSFISINEILPKGASVGVKIKPPTSNTAMSAYVAIVCYIQE